MPLDRRTFLGGLAAGPAGLGLGLGPGGAGAAEPAATAPAPAAPRRRGVSLAGAEFGVRPGFSNENPGRFGKDYTYNSEPTVAYFPAKGITRLRVPFRWERLQPSPGGALDPTELGRLREVVGWAKRHGATVIPDAHNYGRYCLKHAGKVVEAVIDQKVGGETPVTRAHFADLWRRLSEAFRGEAAVEAYGLMNEPHDMGDSDWKAISREAVAAVRSGGDAKLILVPGESWSNSEKWAAVNGPSAWIDEKLGPVAYEAHCYFDADFSGRYALGYDAELAKDKGLEHRGLRRLLPFAGWCAVNGVRGFLGEFGVPGDDPRWLRSMGHFLRGLDRAGLDGCWWAAGDWWPAHDKLSIQPRDGGKRDAPQLATLVGTRAG